MYPVLSFLLFFVAFRLLMHFWYFLYCVCLFFVPWKRGFTSAVIFMVNENDNETLNCGFLACQQNWRNHFLKKQNVFNITKKVQCILTFCRSGRSGFSIRPHSPCVLDILVLRTGLILPACLSSPGSVRPEIKVSDEAQALLQKI